MVSGFQDVEMDDNPNTGLAGVDQGADCLDAPHALCTSGGGLPRTGYEPKSLSAKVVSGVRAFEEFPRGGSTVPPISSEEFPRTHDQTGSEQRSRSRSLGPRIGHEPPSSPTKDAKVDGTYTSPFQYLGKEPKPVSVPSLDQLLGSPRAGSSGFMGIRDFGAEISELEEKIRLWQLRAKTTSRRCVTS